MQKNFLGKKVDVIYLHIIEMLEVYTIVPMRIEHSLDIIIIHYLIITDVYNLENKHFYNTNTSFGT